MNSRKQERTIHILPLLINGPDTTQKRTCIPLVAVHTADV